VPDDPDHAWRLRDWKPGIPDSQLKDLPADQLARMRYEHIEHDLQRDRALFHAVPEHDDVIAKPRDIKAARAQIPGETLAAKRREQQQLRSSEIDTHRSQERIRRRARRGLRPRR
jgi:hypothetical protein